MHRALSVHAPMMIQQDPLYATITLLYRGTSTHFLNSTSTCTTGVCVLMQEHKPKLSVHDQWHGVSCQDKLTVSSVNHLMIILITSPSHQHPRFLPEMSHS